jgi:hypothetical protein
VGLSRSAHVTATFYNTPVSSKSLGGLTKKHMKKIFIHLSCLSIFFVLRINAQNTYSLPLAIGDKWFYKSSSNTNSVLGFIVRQIIDTTSDGFRLVSVNSYYNNNYNTSEYEYWYYASGKFYIGVSPIIGQFQFPIYISSLTQDSSVENIYSWHNEQVYYLGKPYNAQICSVYTYMGRNGWESQKFRITEELGLSDIVNENSQPGKYTMSLVGIFKNNVLIGDSTNTILSVRKTQHFPEKFTLNQNYPNPFNPTTIISYLIPRTTFVSLKLYNILGEEIGELVNSIQSEGKHEVVFNASKFSGGIYFYKIQTQYNNDIKKCIYLK